MTRLLLYCFVVFFALPSFAQGLVFIHSYHYAYPWVKEYRSGFKQHIANIDVHEFQMDTKRRPQSEFYAAAEEAWSFIVKNSPEMVVVADDNALRLLGPRLIEQQIPFFFLGINANPRNYIAITSNVSGVLERPLMKRSVYMISKVLPDVKRIQVLMDATPTSKAILETSFSNQLNQTITGIEVDTRLVARWEEWQALVIDAKKNGFDAVIIANYAALKDTQGTHYTLDHVSEWTSDNSSVPLFAFWSYSVGVKKAVGGLSISAFDQGAVVAKLINQYLVDGVMPMIATPERGAFVFSKTELERWQLSLPSEIKNKAVIFE